MHLDSSRMQLLQAIRKITGAKKLRDHRTIAQTVNKWFELLTFGFTSKRSKVLRTSVGDRIGEYSSGNVSPQTERTHSHHTHLHTATKYLMQQEARKLVALPRWKNHTSHFDPQRQIFKRKSVKTHKPPPCNLSSRWRICFLHVLLHPIGCFFQS